MAFVGVLGPLVMRAADRTEVRLGSLRQRRLLSALVLHAGTVAEPDRLVDMVWNGVLPADPANALQTNIARLRRALPAPLEIVTEPAGYRLVAAQQDAIDVQVFERTLGTPDRTQRLARLDTALALWRGRPYAELDHPLVSAELVRLSELRSAALELRAEELLAHGRTGEAIAELEGVLAAEPLREGAVGLLMRALVAAGRQGDALQAFARLRTALADELGLDPSAELRELEGRVLRQELGRAVQPAAARPRLPVSSFVGRSGELAAVLSALRTDRVVTLTGPGGVGKSRLALHAAHAAARHYADGVAVVALDALHRPEEVEQALAADLGLAGPAGGGSLTERIVDVLATRQQLLVLDDCEHLADSVAALVEAVTTGAPRIDVLLTSREALRVDGERVHRVAPLDPHAAVALLTERIRAVDPSAAESSTDQELFAEVCRRLDGLPLALELAAARVPALGLRGMLDALDEPFEALRQGRRTATPRHRSLHDVVQWSFGLLTEDQRVLFVRLAVFAGAVEAAAVGHVCGDARALPDLVERSLVIRLEGSPMTFGMLETLRAFGRSRLAAAAESADLHARHAGWAVRLADELGRQRWTPEEPLAVRRFDAHLPDLRRAHEWLCDTGRLQDALRLSLLFAEHAYLRGRVDLAALVDATLHAAGRADHPLLPRLLGAAARYSWQQGDLAGAERRCRRAIAMAERLGDPSLAVDAHEAVGVVSSFRGELNGALRDIRHALEMATGTAGEYWTRLEALASLVTVSGYAGDEVVCAAAERDLVDFADRLGAPTALAWACYVGGERRAERNPAEAVPYLERALAHAEASDSAFVAGLARHTLLTTAARTDDAAAALPRFGPLIDHWYGLGAWTQLWIALRALVEVLSRRGRHREVAVLLGADQASHRAAPVYGGDAERLKHAASAARVALGAEFEVARAEGMAMGDVEAVALARRLARTG